MATITSRKNDECPRRYRYKGQYRPRAVQDGTALPAEQRDRLRGYRL